MNSSKDSPAPRNERQSPHSGEMFSRITPAGLLPEELAEQLRLSPPFRGTQIFEWIHKKGAAGFEEMSNLSKDLRSRLSEEFGAPLTSRISAERIDEDGTAKLGITLLDGTVIETVLLTDENGRRTACLSSQVGCAMGCRFCRTATMGLVRNMDGGEIAEQLLHLRSRYGEIDNIVFMGMGEPLANPEEVRRAVAVFSHPKGLGMSHRRITISTCGITGGIHRLAAEGPPVRLAVSLVSADAELREALMPIAAANPLDELKKALREWYRQYGKRITLEYVAIGGQNTSPEDAKRLARFAEGLAVMVNVIPWNPAAELPFREPDPDELEGFLEEIERHGLSTTRRFRRGRGVNGACGQLAVLKREEREGSYISRGGSP